MKYVDLTPTWTELLPAMLAVITNHEDTEAGRQAAHDIRIEFSRMARAADLWNARHEPEPEPGSITYERARAGLPPLEP